MIIQFYSKNWAKYDDKELNTTIVPRVGELIDAGDLLNLSPGEPVHFFVTKVIYKATNDGLTPVVECRQWLQGDRLQELMERGWLPGFEGKLTHDDA